MIEAQIHKVLFGPNDDIEAFILNQIDLAKNSITMLVFWFTWKPIADRLNQAVKRGVDVKMILDSRSTEIKLKDIHPGSAVHQQPEKGLNGPLWGPT